MSTNKPTSSNKTVQDSSTATTLVADSLYPGIVGFTPSTEVPVGGVILDSTPIDYYQNRKTQTIVVRNTGDRPIQVGSHFHFFEINRYMEFDRKLAFGYHLNIPATTAIRFEPGEQREVDLVAYGGKRRVIGFNNLVDAYTGDEDEPSFFPSKTIAFNKMTQLGFKSITEAEAETRLKANQKETKK